MATSQGCLGNTKREIPGQEIRDRLVNTGNIFKKKKNSTH